MKPHLAAAALGLAALAGHSAAADPQLARNLAATCANCHGTDGRSTSSIPSLAGMPAADLQQTMAAFKSGARPATIMHQIAKGYTDAQVALIAGYFAAQR